MKIAILGRQPVFGIAEIEKVFGASSIETISDQTVLFETPTIFNIQHFGGILKAGEVVFSTDVQSWRQISEKIIHYYLEELRSANCKITIGISVYGIKTNSREIQKTGIELKQKLKKANVSLRLIPNNDGIALSTATSHNNKLGLSPNKIELLVVRTQDSVVVAESTGAQNITSYAKRDQARPKRDAFVGMLPPKLAQIMINLAYSPQQKNAILLDPFCGTGVVLQEASLMGYKTYGTDISEKMINYSRTNLDWLAQTHKKIVPPQLEIGDATKKQWQKPINLIVSETYLGQPFSAPPSDAKLSEVKDNCNHIVEEFLKNLSSQIQSKTPICIAIPAWRNTQGNFTHIPLIQSLGRLGYKRHEFRYVSQNNLVYYRDNQVVARELLVLEKQ